MQNLSLLLEQVRSKRKILAVFITFSLFAFLLVFIGVKGFLDRAFMELYFGQYWPPEFVALFPAFTLTQFHDIGILLASVGLVFLYLPITLTLFITEKSDEPSKRVYGWFIHFLCYSDFLKILGFLGLFLASTGVWFCMHQAFLYQGEYLKGTLPSNIYIFLTFEIPPLFLHSIGNLFVNIGLITIIAINAIKVILGLLTQQGRIV